MASEAPPWQAILEAIESQNRMTTESVEVNRAVMENRLREVEVNLGRRIGLVETALETIDRESRARDASLELTLRGLNVTVRELGAEVHDLRTRVEGLETRVDDLRTRVEDNSAAIREVSPRLQALSRLEERIATLEKRTT
jgi:hypothetical protein